jgi:DNA-binding NarL/FixJ family response regulator/tRNA A-37 threonylcarbamoyl transferase component Bud32
VPTLFIVEDQQLLRLGLKIHLESLGCCSVIGESGDGELALREIIRLRPDVVLLDIGLPGLDGIEVTWRIKQELPHVRVVIFSSHADAASVTSALGAGADGYCSKDAPVEQISNAIASASRGEVWLDPTIANAVISESKKQNDQSHRQLSSMESGILNLIDGYIDHEQIAHKLGIDSSAVAKILRNLLKRATGESGNRTVAELTKRREQLSSWLTAFVEQIDTGKLFAEKYLLLELIGEGGIGAVFKARHIFIERMVAVKFLHPEVIEDPLTMRSFQREATAIANIQHNNIVTIFDFGISLNNEPYLVMELIKGSNLSDILQKDGKLPIKRALRLAIQICEGLDAAHKEGIVHCDLKPANILIRSDGLREEVKLVDFGLVQLMPRHQSGLQQQLTNKYFICGTPLYMSPEQCSGKPVDASTDIYSFGCVLFEMITGETIFAGETSMALFAKHIESQPPRLSSVFNDVLPAGLSDLIDAMLQKRT